MNYRHAFHAGNFADVVKHSILLWLVDRLKQKDKAFSVLDTHAGIGLYDLAGEQAGRTAEAVDGILKLAAMDAPPPALAPYIEAVRAVNGGGSIRHYPGSPMIVANAMRPGDRLILNELHETDQATLRRTMAGIPGVHIHHGDAYQSLRAHLPPRERRGLVLIDPPFEVADEFSRLGPAIRDAHRLWPQACIAVWYPVKDPVAVAHFVSMLAGLSIPGTIDARYMAKNIATGRGLAGCGMAFINAPWMLDQALAEILPAIATALASKADQPWSVETLVEGQ